MTVKIKRQTIGGERVTGRGKGRRGGGGGEGEGRKRKGEEETRGQD